MTELLIYKELIDAIGAAGDAITKIVDGVKHLVVTGASGYNYVSAEREKIDIRTWEPGMYYLRPVSPDGSAGVPVKIMIIR